MITKRTLEGWRKEALIYKGEIDKIDRKKLEQRCLKYEDQIKVMTQILLDQHLIRRKDANS